MAARVCGSLFLPSVVLPTIQVEVLLLQGSIALCLTPSPPDTVPPVLQLEAREATILCVPLLPMK